VQPNPSLGNALIVAAQAIVAVQVKNTPKITYGSLL